MKEIWKQYTSQRTFIEVSNLGNIRGTKWNGCKLENKLCLRKGRKCIGRVPIYRLVDFLFRGPVPDGYVPGRLKNKVQ